jgi:hypothetical protein
MDSSRMKNERLERSRSYLYGKTSAKGNNSTRDMTYNASSPDRTMASFNNTNGRSITPVKEYATPTPVKS